MPKKKLLLIDCLNIMYRYHHSFLKSPMFTGSLNTSSIFGLLKQMVTASLQFDIDTVIICHDEEGDSFRKDHYPEYKEGRSPQPEEITKALEHLPQIFESMNVAFVEADKLEADDIIGTYTKWGLELDFEVYILSGDKDFCQLLEKDVYLLKKGKDGDTFDIWDNARVLEEFGLHTAKDFIDILGLEGDKTDNYMGAKGIGIVTACKWITKYGSINMLYQHLDDLTPNKRGGLTRDREDVYLAQWLATIFCDGRDRMPCLVELTTDDILEPAKAVPMLAQYRMFSVMDQIGFEYERNV